MLLIFFERADDMVCTVCGRCYPAFGLHHVSRTHPDVCVYGTRAPNTPYKSLFHFHERLSVLEGRTSLPTRAHLVLFKDKARTLFPDATDFGREEVRAVLHACDNLDDDEYEHYFGRRVGVDRKPEFLKTFLERWPAIRLALSKDVDSPVAASLDTDKLDALFVGVQQAWRRVRPPYRLNMPNFSYIMLKLFEMDGREDIYPWLHQLKTRFHLWKNEEWWEDICECNGWPAVTIFPVPFGERRRRFDEDELIRPFRGLLASYQTPEAIR